MCQFCGIRRSQLEVNLKRGIPQGEKYKKKKNSWQILTKADEEIFHTQGTFLSIDS